MVAGSLDIIEMISLDSKHLSNVQLWLRTFQSSLRIWSHLLKKSLIENFIFCAVSRKMHEIFQLLVNVSKSDMKQGVFV